jgi:hypothetical protein
MKNVTATQFAKTHATDADWVVAMTEAGLNAIVLNTGESVVCNGYKGTVVSHYWNGMYNVRVPGGECCVDANSLTSR